MPAQGPVRLVIAICTRRRPVMLARALASLDGLQLPAGVGATVIVVENDTGESVRALVETRPGPLAHHYFLEPEAGLSPARNRCIAKALALGADWIAFCDDDTEASPGWVSAWFRAASSFPDARAFVGRSTRIYPEGTPAWLAVQARPPLPTGSKAPVYTTANAFVRRDAVASDGLALRFDDSFRFTGGEDSDFLDSLARLGSPPLWIDDAVNFERYSPERKSLGWALGRHRIGGNINARVLRKHDSAGVAAVRNLRRFLRLAVNGTGKLAWGLAALPFARTNGMRAVFQGLGNYMEASGIVQAYLARPTEAYRTTIGS